jgi:hypothetical protein
MRNYIQSEHDLGYKIDIRRQVATTDGKEANAEKQIAFKEKLTEFANNMTTDNDHILTSPFMKFTTLVFNEESNHLALAELFGQTAINIVTGYLSLDYDSGRNKYYELVMIAETTFSEFLSDKTNTSREVNLMIQTSHALVYRAESYVFSNTVMDVVRGFQNKEYELIKTNGTLCSEHANQYAPCIIGPYGYVISLLENIGYIYRFYRTYCVEGDHYNPDKCNRKNTKYINRVAISFQQFVDKIQTLGVDSIFNKSIHYENYITQLTIDNLSGGKRRRKTRRRHSTRRLRKNTRRYRRKSSRR